MVERITEKLLTKTKKNLRLIINEINKKSGFNIQF